MGIGKFLKKVFTRSAIKVPAQDGYHFGDDHPWGSNEQQNLIDMLDRVSEALEEAKRAQRATQDPKRRVPRI